jgi:hypothetical protein
MPMASDAHKQAFSTSFARAIVDFKAAVERGDKPTASIHYVYACGLISGATLSGGFSKRFGLRLMSTLEDYFSALMKFMERLQPTQRMTNPT